jgi:hypothetical protein
LLEMPDPAGPAILVEQSQRQIVAAFCDGGDRTFLQELRWSHHHHRGQDLQPNGGQLPGLRENKPELLQQEKLD